MVSETASVSVRMGLVGVTCAGHQARRVYVCLHPVVQDLRPPLRSFERPTLSTARLGKEGAMFKDEVHDN